jgi:glyoxylase-like metal-dependent hydrolase (beta-lactamase superfamily II)
MVNILDVGYRSTRYYVLANEHPRLLIDAGWPDTLPQLRHQCRVKDILVEQIPYLLCTHYHPDHAGLARELRRLGMRLIVTETQMGAFRRWMAGRPDPQPGDLIPDVDLPAADSRAFLRKLGIEGEIAPTPGHSEDSVSLVLDTGEAFIGDLGSLDLASGSEDDPIRRSWNALIALGVNSVYPSHEPHRRLERGPFG